MSRRAGIFQISFLILFLAIAVFLIRGFIRRYVVEPVFYAGLFLYQLYDALPQQWVWAILVMVGTAFSVRELSKFKVRVTRLSRSKRRYPGRIETWERWLDLANQGELYRLKLASELSDLTLSTLANKEGESIAIVRRKLKNGGILLPDEAMKIINSTLMGSDVSLINRIIHRFSHNRHQLSINHEVEETVRYLEAELEVQSGESSRQN